MPDPPVSLARAYGTSSIRDLRRLASFGRIALLVGSFGLIAATTRAQQAGLIPHAQDRPPGPALSPSEAIAKMTVPPGFRVELVASEPEIVNPVAMTFDERGRIWITESLEYPRRSPGPGRDRIKVLEDTDGDGKADKFTVFAEGLNIPSGIAVGSGGVWVANAPDILFLQDTDGDGKADKTEVVVTGFGRFDTHELPNSLTWGPDGWLYGWNGVFNPARVEHRGKVHEFTCAIFRIHPKTRDFEVFCEGVSNPWGIAFNEVGDAFASACVIDHLWHLTETGYYHRQGGPYPPFTWKLESIVDHQHQKAAYCGITYFDSASYPEKYRGKLYMGNIHGNGINVDRLEKDGSTYLGKTEGDFLLANDAWFMPVVQKTGPDGSLYVLDWYDRYHCYQDANRDPAGIDRLKGGSTGSGTGRPPASSASIWRNAPTPSWSTSSRAPMSTTATRPSASSASVIPRRAGRSWRRWSSTIRPREKVGCTPSGPSSARAGSTRASTFACWPTPTPPSGPGASARRGTSRR